MLAFTVIVDGKTFSSVESAANAIARDLTSQVQSGMVEVSREMRKALEHVYAKLEQTHGSGWPTGGAPFGTSPGKLSRRSGQGLRSIKDSISVSEPGVNSTRSLTGQISTGRLTVHETGAVITAKRAKYLAMPMMEALDSRGQPRKSGPRAWRDTYVARSRAGNLIIFQKRTGGKVVPLYLLKKKVTIPQRLRLRETFDSMVPHFTAKAIRQLEAALS